MAFLTIYGGQFALWYLNRKLDNEAGFIHQVYHNYSRVMLILSGVPLYYSANITKSYARSSE